MKKSARIKSKRITEDKASQRTLAAGAVGPAGALAYGTLVLTEKPFVKSGIHFGSDLLPVFTRTRQLAIESSFLSSYLPLKKSFYNYGFDFSVGSNSKADLKAIRAWADKDTTTDVQYVDPSTAQTTTVELQETQGEAARRLIDNIWTEFLLLDNVIIMWFDDGSPPQILLPERCTFQDKLGLPVLKYQHGISGRDLDLLPPDQLERFKQFTNVLVSPEFGEHFKVLKRELPGNGFGIPNLYSMFRTFGEIESKEVGFHGQAFNMRAATRHHKIGHKVESGVHAGKAIHFWNHTRSSQVLKLFEKRQGPHDYISNFDADVSFPWPDIKYFDVTAWKGTDLRLRNWGGPVAQMLISDKIVEGGLQFLRAQATFDREMVSRFALPIIKAVYGVPDQLDLQLVWSDLIFNDPTQAADLTKFALQNGLASTRTSREIIGLNSAKEDAYKLAESADTDFDAKNTPNWDSSHGIAPALGERSGSTGATGPTGPTKTGGRKTGGKNNPAPTV